jgi:lipoyl(octanoyl) transferase
VSGLSVCALGPTPYREGLRIQEALVEARAAGATGDWLLFPEHPPVLTMGRTGHEDSLRVDRAALARRGIEVFDVARGGDVTWHGPGQLVGYPIVDLAGRSPTGAPRRDLHAYLRALEGALIEALAGWGIAAERAPGLTGVWVKGRKIASLGIAVRRWVGYHGFALNVAPDLAAFELIHPCGLRDVRMTSVADQLGGAVPGWDQVRREVAGSVARGLGYEGWRWADRAGILDLVQRIESPAAVGAAGVAAPRASADSYA